jgi:hypothetical protein
MEDIPAKRRPDRTGTEKTITIDSLFEIPGESRMGWYNPKTGEVTAETTAETN